MPADGSLHVLVVARQKRGSLKSTVVIVPLLPASSRSSNSPDDSASPLRGCERFTCVLLG